jgi:hypothetical protein
VKDTDIAFKLAVRDLSQQTQQRSSNFIYSIVEIDPIHHYIHLTTPGTAPGSIDDVELLFLPTIVNLRCEAQVTLPPPPFCLQKNCINGNLDQRRRLEKITQMLGLPFSDTNQMNDNAKWTPIFFNSDRVPGFDDEL